MSNSYANIVKTTEPDVDELGETESRDGNDDKFDNVREDNEYEPKCCRSAPNKDNYARWEQTYYRHLIDLRNIFIGGLKDVNPEVVKYYRSVPFFHKFCQFIHRTSSKYVSPYIPELTDEEMDSYMQYQGKLNI